MAKIGCKHLNFCPVGADAGVNVGPLVEANLAINLASGEIYGDDIIQESASEFASGTLTCAVTDMAPEVASTLYGSTLTENELVDNAGDTAPYGALGYYKTMLVGGVRTFEAVVYPKVKAALGNDDSTTKGSSIDFGSTPVTFTILTDATGNWRKRERFAVESEAITYVNTATSVTE